jgi:single-strand DNA-binding protein
MTDTLTLIGLVATIPRHLVTSEGLAITSFRLASTQRRFDRTKNQWVDGETNWYTVTTFRQLAINTAASINKGDRVVVAGRLRIREWQAGDKSGINIEVDADALGHDISWGSTVFSRSVSSTAPALAPATEAADAPTESANDSGDETTADAWAVAPAEPVAVPF